MNENTNNKANGRNTGNSKSKGGSKRNSKPYNKGNKRVMDSRSNSNNPGDINDASYYFPDSQVMNQLASFSFNEYLGHPIELGDLMSAYEGESTYNVPTIMRLRLAPTAGSTAMDAPTTGTSGLNMAAKSLFLKLSAGNMKSTEYGPEDIALAMLGIGNLLSTYSYIKRFFGVCRLFNSRNKTVPTQLLGAMGIEYSDFVENLADYRARFNYIANLINSIPFPANIPYFHKCVSLYDNVYLDDPESPLSQMYVFVPHCAWEFDDAYSESGSGLRTIMMPIKGAGYSGPGWSTTTKMSDLLDIFEMQVGAITGSTALLKVFSDVLRMNQKEGWTLISIPVIDDSYHILPVYNKEIISMITNATVCGSVYLATSDSYPYSDDELFEEDYHPTKGNDVIGDAASATVEYRPVFYRARNQATTVLTKSILNFDHPNPSVEEIVEATRFIAHAGSWYVSDDGGATLDFTTDVSLPDHIIVNLEYDLPDLATGIGGVTSSGAICGYSGDFALCSKLSQFSAHPYLYRVQYNTEGVTENVSVFGDVKYYTVIDKAYSSRLHDFAMLGLFTLR